MNGHCAVLSVENLPKWSWSHVLGNLASRLGEKFSFRRLFRFVPGDFRRVEQEVREADVVLCQNVDLIKHVHEPRKTIGRLGGIRTMKGNPHRYDEALASVAAVISTNQELHAIASRCNRNAHLLPNALDLELFRPAASREDRPFTVGFAGNVAYPGALEYKGYHFILGACMKTGFRLHSALYGQTQVAYEEMPAKFYHKIDCLVSASVGEGCSNVVMEALACGVPVALTQVGYHGETLRPMRECVFIERDADDIAYKLRLLESSPSLRATLSSCGRIFAEEHHDMAKLAEQYRGILLQVARGR